MFFKNTDQLVWKDGFQEVDESVLIYVSWFGVLATDPYY